MKNLTKMIIAVCVGALMPLLMAPRNGAGTYTLPAGNPVVSGTTISSTVHNNTMSDISTALTNSLTKNGETTATANQPMGGFRHTNVGNPTLRSQYGTVDNIQDGDYVTLSSVAGTNTITGALSPAPTAYVAGMAVVLIPANANTGATTLNISSIGALDVQKWVSGAQANIVANDLRAGVPAYLVLDTGGDDWILLNPNSGNLGDVTIGTLTSTTINNSGTTTTATLAASTITLGGNSIAGANPTGSVGLSAANGSASTYLRSDGAPALSQAIAPTWTAQHTFSLAGGGLSAAVLYSSATPLIAWNETDGASNNKLWDMGASTEQFLFRIGNDANNTFTNIMTVDRTGTTVDRVAFPTSATSIPFSVGASPSSLGSGQLAQFSTSLGIHALTARNTDATFAPLAMWNSATSGDNFFAAFYTEGGSGTLRGSIDYNRAGGAVRYNTTSDERLKKNFKPAASARGVIDCIKIESFDWKESGLHVDHGVVAQRLNKCAPYAVSKGDVWQVDKSTLIPAMIKYMQEQDARIIQQEKRIQTLEAHQTALLIKEVEELRARMSKLEDEPRMIQFDALPAANRGTIEYKPSGGSVRYNIAGDRRAK